MSAHLSPEEILQSILQNVQIGGNLTTGDITQILNLIVVIKQIDSFKPTEIPQNVPRSGTIKFVGRAQALEGLHQMLQQKSQIVLAAIEGMGGVGKTELATQYALLHLLVSTYTGGICWLRARDEDVGIQIVQFAEAKQGLKPPEDWDLASRVDYCWSRWHQGNVLIVLDDVNDYQKVEPYLPPQFPRFKVLITTRLQLDDLTEPYRFTLDVLSESAAVELLEGWIGAEKIERELADAKEVCQWLGYLPLALNLVGRYVKKRKLSLAEMLRRLKEKKLSHESLVRDSNDRTWALNIKRGVEAAFELSWEELSESAQQLGCLLSLFALAGIPWLLVERAAVEQDFEELEDARVELENLHLLQGEEIYQLHQLIREFFREKLEQSEQANEQKQNVVAAVVKVSNLIPGTDFLTRQQVITLSPAIPHLTEVAKHLTNYFSGDSDIFRAIGNFYYGQGFHSQAQTWYEQCLAFKKSRFGSEHPKVAMSLNYLGYCYFTLQRCKEAEQLFQQALAITKHQLGEENLDTALFTNNLANNYFRQGHYKEAQLLHQEALAIAKRQLGEEHPRVALILSTLGELYQTQGLYTEAEPLYQEALAIRQGQFGNEHPDVAYSLKMLANIYRLQGRYKEAEPFYLQAVEIWFNKLGTEHPLAVTDINNFTDFLRQVVKEGRESDLSDNSQVQTLISEIRTNPEESE